jgi:ATP-binding cassette, subfamily B, bacterial
MLLRTFARQSPGLWILGVVTAFAQSALLIPIAAVVQSLFDHDLKRGDRSEIVVAGVTIFALYSVAAVLRYLARRTAVRMTSRVGAQLRRDLVAKLHDLPQGWHDQHQAGVVHSLVVSGSERVENMVEELAVRVLPSVLVAVALTVVALVLSPLLCLAFAAVVPGVMAIAYLFGRQNRRRTEYWAEASRAFAAEVHRLLRAIPLTKAHAAEREQSARGGRSAEELASRMTLLGAAQAAYGAANDALGAVAGSVVLVVGGLAVARDALTLGELLAFYAVLALLLRQLQLVGGASHEVAIGFESLRRIEGFLATPAQPPYADGAEPLDFRGGVAFENVSFAYVREPVIRDISLEIRSGERVAILGPNGAGKSTLVGLVMALYEPQSGRLLADGAPYERIDMRSFRRQVGVVLQDPVLFPGTIRENIAFGRPDASDAAIRYAAEAATAAAFVERLPDGYDTRVGDEGVGLSGGQRQRLAVARALLGEPGMLLLDEPTTYLDEAAVTSLMAHLANLAWGPTLVLVTHDAEVTRHAQRVIELRGGRIASDTAATTFVS